ncbi:MAG: alpha/beta hydrolase [Patescibacteria group bacterium]|nr:alpha/beta hydrolase [Patescibacteria group bacterium]
MNKVKIDGTKVAYIREGRGNKQKLLMLHPLFGNNKYYEESIKYLKDDFDILAPDFPGFGLSEKYKDRAHNLENYVGTVGKLCKYLDFKSFHLAGSSLGAMSSIKFASMFPDSVKRMVIQAPPYDSSTYDLNLREKLMSKAAGSKPLVERVNKFFRKMKIKTSRDSVVKFMRFLESHYPDFDDEYGVIYYSFKTLDLDAAAELWANIAHIDLTEEAKSIKSPTLIIIGDKDVSIRPSSMKRLNRLIENSELEIVKGGIHALFLQHPTKMALMTKNFLLNK